MKKNFLKNKILLITGGTGSFGKEFVRNILINFNVKKLIIFSRDELKQSEMFNEFKNFSHKLRFFIGDVRDLPRLKFAFKDVDIVIHAAALKQVPTAEYNPFEVIKTNILGTQNVIDAIVESDIKKAILLSTDKAAAPINLYGASKLAADKIFIAANNYSTKKFSVVRYGNVMMSRGSIMPILFQQKKTGQVSITDLNMTRFSITLNEGVNFVIKCLCRMWGGEIFVPKIPSYKLSDVIKAIAPECKIKIIGIRSGEKIHEEMITETDSLNTVEFKDYYAILPLNTDYLNWNKDKFIKDFESYGAKKTKSIFSYNSKDNNKFLTINQIKKLLK
jgi:UDP-N-acetylglucosamine 4,6-dehydratase (inverting)